MIASAIAQAKSLAASVVATFPGPDRNVQAALDLLQRSEVDRAHASDYVAAARIALIDALLRDEK